MLHYRHRPKGIIVSRPAATEGAAAVRLGTISKVNFEVETLSEAAVTPEERQEMDGVAASYRSAAASRRQWNAINFPETTAEVMAHYTSDATEFEKTLIRATLVRAARTLRVRTPTAEADKTAEATPPARPPRIAVPSPETIASALYDVLTEQHRDKVRGDPRKDQRTTLNGEWDLRAVARTLLLKLA